MEMEDQDDQRSIFVGNIPYTVSWTHLKDLFSQFGDVAFAKVVKDFVTHRSKGYGFVEFTTTEGADRAINASASQLECQGRVLRVKLADHHHSNKVFESTANKLPPSCGSRSEHKMIGSFSMGSEAQINSSSTGAQIDIKETETGNEVFKLTELHDDVLVLIFGHLSPMDRVRIERVCKRWQKCARAASKLQKQLVIERSPASSGFRVFSEQMLFNTLKHYSHNLCSLDVSRVSSCLGNKALEIIGKCCKNLQVLNMNGMDCTSSGMKTFTEQCTKIKSLIAMEFIGFNEKGFWYLFHNCKQLESLDCTNNQGITGKCLKHAEVSLKHLRLSKCSNLVSEGLLQLPSRSPHLRTLHIDVCEKVINKTIVKVLQGLPCLESFSAQLRPFTEDRHFTQYLAKPSVLTVLKVATTGLRDADLQWVCQSCDNLQDLDISCNPVTDSSLTQLVSLRHLQRLSACHLIHATDKSMSPVAQQGRLKVLRVQGCKQITDSFIENLTQCCQDLEVVDIAGASSLTLSTLRHFFLHAAMRPDSKISLYLHGPDFTDESELSLPSPANLTVVANYLRLYPHPMDWPTQSPQEAELLRLQNQEIGGFIGGRGGSYQCGNGGPVDLYHSDEFDEMQDEFLINDDPLEEERFDMS